MFLIDVQFAPGLGMALRTHAARSSGVAFRPTKPELREVTCAHCPKRDGGVLRNAIGCAEGTQDLVGPLLSDPPGGRVFRVFLVSPVLSTTANHPHAAGAPPCVSRALRAGCMCCVSRSRWWGPRGSIIIVLRVFLSGFCGLWVCSNTENQIRLEEIPAFFPEQKLSVFTQFYIVYCFSLRFGTN